MVRITLQNVTIELILTVKSHSVTHQSVLYFFFFLNALILKGWKYAQISFKKMELFLYKPAFISWDLQWKISWHGSFSSVTTSKNSEYQNIACGQTFCASAGYILRLYCILWAIRHTHYIPCVVFCWESVFRAIPEKEWKIVRTGQRTV